MSIQNHLETILGKALAAKAAVEYTIDVVGQIQTLENENRLTPEIEAELLPHVEVVRDTPTPSEIEYAVLNDSLEAAENICKNAG
jgi:hypothetical protein